MLFWIAFLTIAILDRISKYLVTKFLVLNEPWPLGSEFFSLTYIQNRGAAFGILPGRQWFFLLMAVIVILLLIWFSRSFYINNWLQVAMGLIAGGALGNLVDRMYYQAVIDFLSIGWWPVFNIADIGIVGGSLLCAYFLIITPEEELK